MPMNKKIIIFPKICVKLACTNMDVKRVYICGKNSNDR
jgi:hypothetical protein